MASDVLSQDESHGKTICVCVLSCFRRRWLGCVCVCVYTVIQGDPRAGTQGDTQGNSIKWQMFHAHSALHCASCLAQSLTSWSHRCYSMLMINGSSDQRGCFHSNINNGLNYFFYVVKFQSAKLLPAKSYFRLCLYKFSQNDYVEKGKLMHSKDKKKKKHGKAGGGQMKWWGGNEMENILL